MSVKTRSSPAALEQATHEQMERRMKTAAPTNSGDLSGEIEATREHGLQVVESANTIRKIAADVARGTEIQSSRLDAAASLSNEMAASMGETARQLESIASFSEEIASSVNETAASLEQVG